MSCTVIYIIYIHMYTFMHSAADVSIQNVILKSETVPIISSDILFASMIIFIQTVIHTCIS